MAKILVTPVASSGIAPFEVEGIMRVKQFVDGTIIMINGSSYPAEIVTVLKDDSETTSNLHPIFDGICKSFFGEGAK